MSRNWMIAAVVIVVLIVAGVMLTRPQQPATTPESTPSTPTSTESAVPTSATEGAMMAEETVVKITAAGFSPKDITIKAGGTVTWTNSDSVVHAVNSAVHPTHQVYSPLNLGNIQAGGKAALTFPDPGTYKYHDHLNPSLTGSVVVE
ncbi:MAG: Plastocyanin/azurin family copper binding protein [Microgenomates group bacterium Gr01-1014_7]|nr:MAG: Plastocyanin/azurin family copper binding protein [Microgenomates group bacterium Gr01-1014_7]